jgi:hypothetical protein
MTDNPGPKEFINERDLSLDEEDITTLQEEWENWTATEEQISFSNWVNREDTRLHDRVEEALREDVYQDSDIFEWAWEDVYNDLGDLMTEVRKATGKEGSRWLVSGENLGWLHRSGYKFIATEDAKQLLQEILPDTECTFKIYSRGDHIYMWNAHHDAPTGESYYIYPVPYEQKAVWKVPVLEWEAVESWLEGVSNSEDFDKVEKAFTEVVSWEDGSSINLKLCHPDKYHSSRYLRVEHWAGWDDRDCDYQTYHEWPTEELIFETPGSQYLVQIEPAAGLGE